MSSKISHVFLDQNVFSPIMMTSTETKIDNIKLTLEKYASNDYCMPVTAYGLLERLGLHRKVYELLKPYLPAQRVASTPERYFEHVKEPLTCGEELITKLCSMVARGISEQFKSVQRKSFQLELWDRLTSVPDENFYLDVAEMMILNRIFSLAPQINSEKAIQAVWKELVRYLLKPDDSCGYTDSLVYNMPRNRLVQLFRRAVGDSAEILNLKDARIYFQSLGKSVSYSSMPKDLLDTELVHQCAWGYRASPDNEIVRTLTITADEPEIFKARVAEYIVVCETVMNKARLLYRPQPLEFVTSLSPDYWGSVVFLDKNTLAERPNIAIDFRNLVADITG